MVIFFLLRLDQNCPKWIKLDQIVILPNQKMLPYKVVTFIMRIQMVKNFWSDWIRFVQNGSKLDSSLVTLIIVFLSIIYFSLFNHLFKFIFDNGLPLSTQFSILDNISFNILLNSLQWVFFNFFENTQLFNLIFH